MMYLLCKYDVAPLGRNDEMFVKCAVRHTSFAKRTSLMKSTSFAWQANIIEKRLFRRIVFFHGSSCPIWTNDPLWYPTFAFGAKTPRHLSTTASPAPSFHLPPAAVGLGTVNSRYAAVSLCSLYDINRKNNKLKGTPMSAPFNLWLPLLDLNQRQRG